MLFLTFKFSWFMEYTMALVESFFDQETNTVSYVIADSTSKKCAVIDSVIRFDLSSGRTCQRSTESI